MSLAMGAVFWVLLRSRTYSTGWQLFLTLAMAFHLLWGAGYFIFSAITNRGDWAFVLRQLAVEPRWLWRCLMGILGCYL